MHKITVELLIKVSVIFFVIAIVLSSLFGCGGEPPDRIATRDGTPIVRGQPMEPYCGDFICDETGGENYWNCLDCVDINGWPTHGHCGDGICYNESMTDCWEDCRPTELNTDSLQYGPGGSLPDPPATSLQMEKFHRVFNKKFYQGE